MTVKKKPVKANAKKPSKEVYLVMEVTLDINEYDVDLYDLENEIREFQGILEDFGAKIHRNVLSVPATEVDFTKDE